MSQRPAPMTASDLAEYLAEMRNFRPESPARRTKSPARKSRSPARKSRSPARKSRSPARKPTVWVPVAPSMWPRGPSMPLSRDLGSDDESK